MDEQTILHIANSLGFELRRGYGYQARREAEAIRAKAAQDPKRLESFGFKVYSQNEEDGILEEIFNRLGIVEGRFCEIGVQNGLECNTLYLIHKQWRGAWIDGDLPGINAALARFDSLIPHRLGLTHAMVTAENVNTLIEASCRGVAELDLLSIDIDGQDIHLLQALTSRPKVICIEYNAKWPAHLSKAPVYKPGYQWTVGSDYMGSSLKAITEVATAKGYRLVGTNITGANAFFVRADLAGDRFPDDASPEALYNPARYHLTYDLYFRSFHDADFGDYIDLMTP